MSEIYFDDVYSKKMAQEAIWRDKIKVFYVLSKHSEILKLVFRFYMLHGLYKKDKKSFGMTLSQFQTLARDCRVQQHALNKVAVIFKTVSMQVPL